MSAVAEILFGLVMDDAGLFPPASLSMAEAVRRHAAARESGLSVLVDSILCPAARLSELADEAESQGAFTSGEAWEVKVILSAQDGTVTRSVLAQDRPRLGAQAWLTVVGLEAAWSGSPHVLRPLQRLAEEVDAPLFLEVGWGDGWRERMDEALSTWEAFQFKGRMGGTAPVPPSALVAEWLGECADLEAGLRCTAGLHHALTHDEGYGYLNILAAVCGAYAHDLRGEDLVAILEMREADRVEIGDEAFVFGQHSFTAAECELARSAFDGFGTCDLETPYRELERFGLAVESL
ncbi:MAG: hypothetical protein MH204_01505 [Fimbriimonadaceae bacterium]|nr:hypothetical protein [Fimbriimonadaceae bacterium]